MSKRIIAAALAVMLVFGGCAIRKQPEDSYTRSSAVSENTPDNAADQTEENDDLSKKTVSPDSANDSSKKTSSKKTASGKSNSSKKTSSKTASGKNTSSKTSSKKTSSKKTSSAAAGQQPVPIETISYDYEIGGDDDPIRQVAPEDVQKFILEEQAIVTEPKPENTNFENKYEDVDKDIMVDGSWFDDCVFLGDSLTAQLSYYNDAYGVFGDAKFVCSTSLSYWNSQWDIDREDNVHPLYNGEKILLEDAVNVTESKKAIITLGMNDVGYWGPATACDYARSLVEKIKAKSPDTIIYLETVTPMMYGKEKLHLNNAIIKEFNGYLKNLAAEQGCGFLDSYDALVNDAGYLPDEFCSDPDALGLHLKFNGCAVWEAFLKANVANVHPSGHIKGPEPKTESKVESKPEEQTDTSREVTSSEVTEQSDIDVTSEGDTTSTEEQETPADTETVSEDETPSENEEDQAPEPLA